MLAACKGNAYVTTTHVINSCIVKASKLTRVARVYRGVAGGGLPQGQGPDCTVVTIL